MSDRFKFRAWHKEERKMVEVESVYPYQDESTQGGEIFIEGFECSFYFPEECELMQCTGLKDKNGKLIYEGDIVQIPNNWDEYGMLAGEKREIYFNEGGFRLKPKWDKNSRGNWLEDTKDWEVIGNIYENKELLDE